MYVWPNKSPPDCAPSSRGVNFGRCPQKLSRKFFGEPAIKPPFAANAFRDLSSVGRGFGYLQDYIDGVRGLLSAPKLNWPGIRLLPDNFQSIEKLDVDPESIAIIGRPAADHGKRSPVFDWKDKAAYNPKIGAWIASDVLAASSWSNGARKQKFRKICRALRDRNPCSFVAGADCSLHRRRNSANFI